MRAPLLLPALSTVGRPASVEGQEPTLSDSELIAEVNHHGRARATTAAMRSTTATLMSSFERDFIESRRNRRPGDARPDHNMGRAMANFGAQRLEDLAGTDLPLFFARLWLDSGEDYYLGRRHVRDESDRAVPLVIDWRAPLAGRFYRASPHHRLEVTTRRRFGFRGSTLTSFEDEDLRLGTDSAERFLCSEIGRPRTGPMRDIVATIQPEQDELIRQDADASLCVQGAPGTGKTAVGLHRAAWLLYTYPERLSRTGMLVVGPNAGFLRYIAGVLPTLGETSVWQVTVDELTGSGDAPGTDSDVVMTIKHDARMAHVCERAVWTQLHESADDVDVIHGGLHLTLPAEAVAESLRHARATCRTWEAGRKSFHESVARQLRMQAEARTGAAKDNAWVTALKRQPAFVQVMDAAWPRLTAKQVLRRLFGDDEFRASVCAGLLTSEESELLNRTAGKVTPADVLLLDELQAHLRVLTTTQTFGHIVIDEAQDLSPLQCRAIARRCPTGSITALGDLAQGTTSWAATQWQEQMGHLGQEDAEVTALTTGYRVPRVILDLANRVLPHLGVDVSPARSLRSDGSVDVLDCDDLGSGVVSAVEKALVEEGAIGVIAGDAVLERLRQVLPDSERVELVSSGLAKGLEFDHVIVVEPADFVRDARPGGAPHEVTGLRHLYVALTRAVSRLTIVHTMPLPPELGPAPR